ncbi:hypothetical protein CEXT_730791 [Caerostris extrusa]|uniref:Secreted protein n=1 Tax=Caerostris extrusa TaxID=172846 RepID=A0AAV4UJS5_CAEEX|nr:hypothetical protein CEXT_730791 [Caerostris extrusa]
MQVFALTVIFYHFTFCPSQHRGIIRRPNSWVSTTSRLRSPTQATPRRQKRTLPTRRTQVVETDIWSFGSRSAPDHIKTRRFRAGIRPDSDFSPTLLCPSLHRGE